MVLGKQSYAQGEGVVEIACLLPITNRAEIEGMRLCGQVLSVTGGGEFFFETGRRLRSGARRRYRYRNPLPTCG